MNAVGLDQIRRKVEAGDLLTDEELGCLERAAKAFPRLVMGSYPFSTPTGYGANLVVRGRDADELARGVAAVIGELAGAGIAGVEQEEA